MKRILTCKICGKAVKINKYKIQNPTDYTCAKCRGIDEILLCSAKIKAEEIKEEILK